MATVSYRGKTPSTDAALVTKGYIKDRHATLTVNNATIDAIMAPTLANLATQSDVDAGDATRAKKSAVDLADANYLPLSQRGVVNGIASVGADGYVPAAQLPTLITDRSHRLVDASTVNLTGTVSTFTAGIVNENGSITNGKEYQAASLVITDPGFPYLLLPFATVAGRSPNIVSGSYRRGGDTFGKMVILTQNDICWGFGAAGNNTNWAIQQAVPFAGQAGVPSNSTAINGTTTLSLWLSNWGSVSQGNPAYQWTTTGFSFYTWVVPAV
jgi:hypothetical protein